MRLSTPALVVCLLAASASAQTQYRTIAAPGTTIGGHTFSDQDEIGSVAISENGKAAFITHWKTGSHNHSAVFTEDRIVVQDGYTAGDFLIYAIPLYADLAISNQGLVAYFAATVEKANPLDLATGGGIFVERRFLVSEGPERHPAIFLDEDESAVLHHSATRRERIDGQGRRPIIGVSRPKLGQSQPFSLPFASFNAKGQGVIAINHDRGFAVFVSR